MLPKFDCKDNPLDMDARGLTQNDGVSNNNSVGFLDAECTR
jgi:hypothetical protein